jgi:hypothetical protein
MDTFNTSRALKLVRAGISAESELARNPVTGGNWVPGQDDQVTQVKVASNALHARTTRRLELPPEYPRLPLNYDERERLKGGDPLAYLVALFGRSLAYQDFTLDHPPFPDFAAAALLSPFAPTLVRQSGLANRYFTKLPVIIGPGCYWIRPH